MGRDEFLDSTGDSTKRFVQDLALGVTLEPASDQVRASDISADTLLSKSEGRRYLIHAGREGPSVLRLANSR